MSSEISQQAQEALAAAVSLDGKEREEFLTTLEQDSAELAAEVRALLKASETAEMEGFLEMPASEVAEAEDKTIQETQLFPRDDYDTIPSSRDAPVSRDVPASRDNDQTDVLLAPVEPKGNKPFVGEDYKLGNKIGKGGMGEVYQAYQHSLRRQVALKLIPERYLPTPDQVARFQIEAESAASLDHPGIVPVYEVGQRFDVHFYSMALVEGGSLADYVGKDKTNREKPRLPVREAAELMEQVCHAVQYAHDRAVIHRDIKPANILLDEKRKPRLTDFGLAKVLKEEEDLTMTGQVMGTPSYMAPEQASGKQKDISNRTDVYALGATLFALVSGRAPFAAETALTTIKQVVDKRPPQLSEFVPDVPLDLQTICDKCLSKRPVDRYESAEALADDLRRYLDGFPISARPQGWLMRGYLWSRRNPGIAASLAAFVLTLVVASIVSTGFAFEARRQLALSEEYADTLAEAIEKLYIDVSENELLQEPGMQSLAVKLLNNARDYSDKLASMGGVSNEKVARSEFLIGKVLAILGRHDEAIESFEKSLQRYQSLVANHDSDADLLLAISQVHNEYSRLRENQLSQLSERPWFALEPMSKESSSALDSWREHAQKSAELREGAWKLAPKDQELQRLLANAWMNLGYAIVEKGRGTKSSEAFKQALKLNKEAHNLRMNLLQANPDNIDVLVDMAKGYTAFADVNLAKAEAANTFDPNSTHWKDVVKFQSKAIETLSDIPESYGNPDLDWQLAVAYQYRADSYVLLGKLKAASKDYEKSESVLVRLKLGNPQITKYQKKLADSYFNRSQLLLASKDSNGYQVFNDCQTTLVGAILVNPQDKSILRLLNYYSTYMAETLATQNKLLKAEDIMNRAIKLLEGLPLREEERSETDATIERLQQKLEEIRAKSNPVAMATFS